MALTLTRDQALTIPLLSTYGTASLLGRDNREVKVPLVPLLVASTLLRSMVSELPHFHPGMHGHLILSFEILTFVKKHPKLFCL